MTTFAVRRDRDTGSHIEVSVFAGDQPGMRALVGQLTLRPEEADALQALLVPQHNPAKPDDAFVAHCLEKHFDSMTSALSAGMEPAAIAAALAVPLALVERLDRDGRYGQRVRGKTS